MTEDTIRFLGLIRRAGKLEIGDMSVEAVVKNRRARLVLLAEDAGGGITRKIQNTTKEYEIPNITIPLGKQELSRAIGRDNVAVAAVMDLGFSTSLLEKISSEYPEETEYLDSLQMLEAKKKTKRTNRADNRRK